ncbi:MAG: cysteine hydrolase [Deltaproteobacteria bacterium]|nr:cysteine hydrolase [Deltaproteobacteria bacterium]MBW2306446.1 cysteine hydrolase [Deltaproteobacteria bacterium]
MEKKALIVVDMLKDFVEPDGKLYCGETAQAIISFVRNKIEEFHRSGETVIFLMDNHAPDDPEFRMFPPHCVAGTSGAEVIDALPVLPEDYRVPKTRYSGFFRTNLEEILQKEAPKEVHLVGVCTSICVLYTCADLRNRDVDVVVYKEGVADFDPEAHIFALKNIEKVLGARLV